MTIVPGFGPNNQFVGIKDVMYLAKHLGYVMARPDFFTHSINHLDSVRVFEKTFQPGPFNEYVESISLKRYTEVCEHKIDALVWMRGPKVWMHIVKLWMEHTNMTYAKEIHAPNGDHLHLSSNDDIDRYFKQVEGARCIAICFPYMNVFHSPVRFSRNFVVNLL